MKILIVETEKKPRIAEIDGSFHSMQLVVGGNIEAIYPFEDYVALICNDEGKLNNLPLNRSLYHPETHQLYDIISGTFFVCAAPPDEENFNSLTSEQLQYYANRFERPELFLSFDGSIIAIPLED